MNLFNVNNDQWYNINNPPTSSTEYNIQNSTVFVKMILKFLLFSQIYYDDENIRIDLY